MRGYTVSEDIPTCPHNSAVYCKNKEKPCKTCGWNPEVQEARLKKIRSTHQVRKGTRK